MRRITGMALLLCILLSAKGQTRMKFSIHADPQFIWLSSDEEDVAPDGSILHIHPGLDLDLFFMDKYAFNLGFGLNHLGGRLLYADSTLFRSGNDSIWATAGQSVKYRMQYLDFPLGLKLKTEELGYATFFFRLGFNPMIRIHAWADSGDDTFNKDNVVESTNLFNLGYHAGAGVEYSLGGSTALIGGIRWSAGLTDVTGDDFANVTTRAVSIHIGVQF